MLLCQYSEKCTPFRFRKNHLTKQFHIFIQEAVVQYEQYEQEVRDLQGLIEEAHRVIQDRPIPSSNIQELQAQILHHEVQFIIQLSLIHT